jgi:hypothetical protein
MDYEARRKKVLKAARSLMAEHGRDFTVVDLCQKAGLSKSQLRPIFSTKAALLAALDEATTKPPAKPAETKAASESSERVEHRFRLLQRAIALLEARIDAVGAEQARHELACEAAGIENALSAASPEVSNLAITEHEAEVMQEASQADDYDGSVEAPIAAEEALPPVIEDPPVCLRPVAPAFPRDVLDGARVLANNSAERNARLQRSERKSNLLTLISATTIVMVGLTVGLVSMGGAARATRAPFATTSETLAKASGITIINATGAVVPDQLTPEARALTERAEKGDAGAQAELALAYLRGDGVVSNSAAAAGWAGLAANKGQPMGQFILATLYNSGIKPDPRIGFRWMSAAALNGNVKAMHNVAVAFVSGSGIEKNPGEAANWFSKAASMGYRDSAFDLAVLYERGEGVPQSTQRALYWYDKAASVGDKESAERAHLLRFGVPKTDG